jgi:putative addiction module component (TIGR02574 family)
MDTDLKKQILGLPIAERIRIAGELWDSLSDSDIKLTPQQKSALRKRLAHARANREGHLTLNEFRKKIQQAKRQFQKNRRQSA